MKHKLNIHQAREQLGLPTIMSPVLAERYGAPYVHLAAFAIDVDRLCEVLDDQGLPFGWEIFLTEVYLLKNLDPTNAHHHELIEETCLSVLDIEAEDFLFGTQLPFAVFNAVQRGVWPQTLSKLFSQWQRARLPSEVAMLWADAQASASKLAQVSLNIQIDPPLAPPTIQALQRLI